MGERVILHSDLNNFFASVECLEHPELAGLPVAVGGSVESRHGVVLAKNQEARKYGVKTAETLWQAKEKCPNLVVLAPHFHKYVAFSKAVQEIYARYTDRVEACSIDECWLDVTGCGLLFGSGYQIADQIRLAVKHETGLTVSVGVSFNKSIAKLASDRKKPDGITLFNRCNYQEEVWPLPVETLCGVGKQTCQRLRGMGVMTIGDLARCRVQALEERLGKNGRYLWRCANGLEEEPVRMAAEQPPPKSVGRSVTCPKDLTSPEEVWQYFLFLSEQVSAQLRMQGYLAEQVQIGIKDTSLKVKEYQGKLPVALRLGKEMAKAGFALFQANWRWQKPVRAVGIRAGALVPDNMGWQPSFFIDSRHYDREEKMERSVDALRERFGKNVIVRAALLSGQCMRGREPAEGKNFF